MPHKLQLEIISQEKKLLKEEAEQVLAPSNLGQIGILPGHISLFSALEAGELIIVNGHQQKVFAITGGFLDVNQDQVTVLANSAVRAKDIDIKKAEEAKKKAQETMKNKLSEREYKLAEADLRKAVLELGIAKKRRARSLPGQK